MVKWGFGDEDESLFAPTAVPDPEQWLTAVKAAGMKGGIAVVKHQETVGRSATLILNVPPSNEDIIPRKVIFRFFR